MAMSKAYAPIIAACICVALAGCSAEQSDAPYLGNLERACADDDVVSCEELALLYLNGDARGQARSPAYDLAQFFCTQGIRRACAASDIELVSNDGVVQGDSETILAGYYFRRACGMDSAQSCFDYARLLRNAVTEDARAERVAYAARACALGLAEACLSFDEEEQASPD